MYLKLNGPDFLRVQTGANALQGDPLHPDVVFSGAFDDGTCMFFQAYIGVGGNVVFPFGRTLPFTPIVFGTLCLSEGLNQSGRIFNQGEYIGAQLYRKQEYNKLPMYDCMFAFNTDQNNLYAATRGFAGVATFLVVDN